MDVLTILGGVASIFTITDTLYKVVAALTELRSQWRDADSSFCTLRIEIKSLLRGLEQIEAISKRYPNAQTVTPKANLDEVIAACQTLAVSLSKIMSNVQHNRNHPMDAATKARFIVQWTSSLNLQDLLRRQREVLMWMLAVMSLESQLGLQAFLQKPESIRIAENFQDDAASIRSLENLRLPGTEFTERTSCSSQASLIDTQSAQPHVHKQAFWTSVRQGLREGKERMPSSNQVACGMTCLPISGPHTYSRVHEEEEQALPPAKVKNVSTKGHQRAPSLSPIMPLSPISPIDYDGTQNRPPSVQSWARLP